jgi:hypothetical protein
MAHLEHPSIADVERIASVADPVVRNLLITQCYFEISRAFRARIRPGANWCTFATWASKQAGRTVRREDLVGHFQDLFQHSPELQASVGALVRAVGALGIQWEVPVVERRIMAVVNPETAFARASDAVSRGNLKVFAEIGREFTRFLATFAADAAFEPEKTTRFCAALLPGSPPQGQQWLRDAFTLCAETRFSPDPEVQAETLLCANLLAGFHEQTRLQPEIEEALNAALDAERTRQLLVETLLPVYWVRIRYRLAVLAGRKLPLDDALDRLLAVVQQLVRKAITHHLMTIHVSGEILQLGRDLAGAFSPPLAQITNSRLNQLLADLDPTPNSLIDSGARDWADLKERMHFIADFFRCYHQRAVLFDSPFNDQQVQEIKLGVKPAGPL